MIITKGDAGCSVVGGSAEPVDVPGVKVEPVNTTGCGDAFMGAVACQLASGVDLVEAARCATGVGAFAATRAGAQMSYPTRDEPRPFLA